MPGCGYLRAAAVRYACSRTCSRRSSAVAASPSTGGARAPPRTETYRDGKSKEFLTSLERMSAFGRLGQPGEIATVVTFLASDRAGWITGQNIRVNGGTA
jgi:NAD(P)-dependent dehydrogenase (short-subunit alcohol dehydrogenase family)